MLAARHDDDDDDDEVNDDNNLNKNKLLLQVFVILIHYTQLYSFMYDYLIQIICRQLYSIKYSCQVLPIRARVDLGAMAMKGCSAFPKPPVSLELHHNVIIMTPVLVLGVLPLCKESVYSTVLVKWAILTLLTYAKLNC